MFPLQGLLNAYLYIFFFFIPVEKYTGDTFVVLLFHAAYKQCVKNNIVLDMNNHLPHIVTKLWIIHYIFFTCILFIMLKKILKCV